ncbi:hypothetical protein C8F04DRAFT_386297 [Mycena alexandri]|uniref:Arrestin-like N-terminal domain-containing protein n=1 Tax=Mycena alexandri TaxID=1745969 RepID=A0AAD6T3V5_9AGAR|nr:hypothetical protein C8F04DRAFT_386297 [Mycena alexandri]
MAATSSEPQLITLRFPNLVRVAGETIEVHIDFNVPLARKDGIENLRFEVRGVIKTQIYRQYGQVGIVHKETVPLFSSVDSLWTPESPDTGSDVVSFPFRFKLPDDLPPSFYCWEGTIRYSLEVVGERPGKLHRNRRARKIFSVTPAASQSQLLTKESLRQGWTGPWKETKHEEKIRHGIWGEYSHVYATLSIPDLPSLPIATPIPYSFQIVTETKTVDHSDHPDDKHGHPLFPAPPTLSTDLTQVLRRKIECRVRERKTLHQEKKRENFDLQKNRRLAEKDQKALDTDTVQTESVACTEAVEAVVDEPEWIPKDHKSRGIWRRSVRFTSTITLPFAPTLSSETIDWRYILQFVVPFPGLKNDLKLEIPLDLGPGLACPPPPTGAPGSSSHTYADVLPAGPAPSMLDLPPAYWGEEGHDWDDDKKS